MQWAEPPPEWGRLVTDPDRWTEGFPFFLGDMRPQGFVGRAIARQVAAALSLPDNPTKWGDDEVLFYLQSEGEDLPGDFVVGDLALRRLLARQLEPVETVDRAQYTALALRALQGGVPGSSAGGEQQKFLARVADGEVVRSVIVKFSPSIEEAAGRRWADLLLAEATASQILAQSDEGIAAVRLIDADGRRFLEIPRFDRVGTRGRRGVLSLDGLQGSEQAANTTHWVAATEHFESLGTVGAATAASVRRRHAFGELIGNSDMHPGNLSFFLDASVPLRLTPSYDMLPMLWAPATSGEIVERVFNPQPPTPRQMPDWTIAAQWAEEFWARLAGDARLSPEFATIARSAGEKVNRLRREYGG